MSGLDILNSLREFTPRQKHLASLVGTIFAGVFFPPMCVRRPYVGFDCQRDEALKYTPSDNLWCDVDEEALKKFLKRSNPEDPEAQAAQLRIAYPTCPSSPDQATP